MRLDSDGNLDLSDAERVSPMWLAVTVATGLLVGMIGVAGSERYGWHAVYVEACINAATGIALVGVLYVLERRLVGRVRQYILEPPMCTLADPPERIVQRSVFGSGEPGDCTTPFGCDHRPIEHRWDSITGKRLSDHRGQLPR